MAYSDLHVHSDGSNTRGFLDSTNRIADLFSYTKELGQKSFALTDHDTITMHMKALHHLRDLRKKDPETWNDYKIILGNEIYLCSRKLIEEDKKYNFYHFILLAKDYIGHQQIQELSTRAWTKNSFFWVNIRTPTFYDDLFEVVESNPGHLIGSTACLGGILSEYILEEYRSNPEAPNYHKAKKWISRMIKCFGDGNFFLEMQPSYQEDQLIVNKAILKISKEMNIPYIITTDGHYLKKEDRPIHEAFLKSNEDVGKEREVGDFYATTYMMDENEIHSYMDESLGYEAVQKGIDNTQIIVNMCEEYSLDQKLEIPYEPTEETEPDKTLIDRYCRYMPKLKEFAISEYQCNRHLAKLVLEKIKSRPEEFENKETYQAIEECLNTLRILSDKQETEWAAYLIQVRDLVAACWEAGSLVGDSRGSGVGFILLYMLDITQVNPLREEVKTYPWRFLNPERVSPADCDIDFENSKRDEVIKILQRKYCGDDEQAGIRRVTKVQTLSTMKSKNAILTACRGLGYAPEEAQMLSAHIGAERGIQFTLKQTYYGDEENNLPPDKEFQNLMDGKYKDVWEVAQKVEGLVSGVGSHAGGVILTPRDITNYTALMKTSAGDIITQYDLHQAEDAGLIKFDLLSVDSLQKIHVTLNLLLEDGLIEWQGNLKDTYEKYVGVYNIERDNSEIWDMINNHKIISFFHMEKQSGIQAIKIGKPRSLVDLSALNSVMRLMAPEPGAESPLERYGRFKENINLWYDEMTQYGLTQHEQDVVRKYAEKSYGLLPNQENFMMIVQDPEVGGLGLLWADRLRKSIA